MGVIRISPAVVLRRRRFEKLFDIPHSSNAAVIAAGHRPFFELPIIAFRLLKLACVTKARPILEPGGRGVGKFGKLLPRTNRDKRKCLLEWVALS